MPILNCYVDDRTLAILRAVAERDTQGRDATRLAEDAIADAAIRSIPPQARERVSYMPSLADRP